MKERLFLKKGYVNFKYYHRFRPIFGIIDLVLYLLSSVYSICEIFFCLAVLSLVNKIFLFSDVDLVDLFEAKLL